MIRGDPQAREAYDPGSPRTTADTSSGFVKVPARPACPPAWLWAKPTCLWGLACACLSVRGRLACLWGRPPACCNIGHRLRARPPSSRQAMSDAGLKPVIVYHNLAPAELYEKVRKGERWAPGGHAGGQPGWQWRGGEM